MKKPKRFIRGLREISNGQPNFIGRVTHRGPYKFPKGTLFSVNQQADLGDNPEEILLCVHVSIPIKDDYVDLYVDFSDSLNPRRHTQKEYLVPAEDLHGYNSLAKKISVADVFAFIINTSNSANLRIVSGWDDPKNIGVTLEFEHFKVTGSLDSEDVPGAADFFERQLLKP